jgi:hypothetical protein
MTEERTDLEHCYSLTPPPPLPLPQARLAPEPTEEELNERIRRLEAALAAMQDTKLMEDRLIERVIHRIDQAPANGTGQATSEDKAAEAMIAAGSRLIPSAMRVLGSQIGAATSPTAPPSSGLLSAQSWLLTDLLQELRTFFAMYIDHRYRTSWPAKLVPPMAFAIFVLSWIFMHGSVIFIGSLLDYTLDFLLAILVYKTLQREATRYRAAVAGLPPRQRY